METLVKRHKQQLANLRPTFRRQRIDEIQWNERLVGIKGERGVGKTTLCLQRIKEHFADSNQCLYVSLDDVSFPFASLLELAERFSQRGGTHLFIDEIHKYPNWMLELKNIYDIFPDLSVVFTGSSVLHLDHSKADLSRRAVMYQLNGLSFREFLQIQSGKTFEKYSFAELIANHEKITFDIVSQLKPLQFFNQYLQYGYYPFYLQNTETYGIKLSALINQVIESDLPYLAQLNSEHINKLKRFLYLLSCQVPFKPNISSLATAMQLSRQTISNYLHLLQKAGIITLLSANNQKINSLAKPEKIFLQHPNYYFALGNENANVGSIRETFFVNQMSYNQTINTSDKGDFLVNGKYIFEIGGTSKKYTQIANLPDSYIVIDDIEFGIGNKIPLWLFGFLY